MDKRSEVGFELIGSPLTSSQPLLNVDCCGVVGFFPVLWFQIFAEDTVVFCLTGAALKVFSGLF